MMRIKTSIITIVGLFFLVACGGFEAYQPEKPGLPGVPAGLKLDTAMVDDLLNLVLGPRNSLFVALHGAGANDEQAEAFLKTVEGLDRNRFNIKGITVTRTGSAANSISMKVEALIEMGGYHWVKTYQQTYKVSEGKLVIGQMTQTSDETEYIPPPGEDAGLATRQAVLEDLGLDKADAGEVTKDVLKIESDKVRPVSSYVSCGGDLECKKAAVILQFHGGDAVNGFASKAKDSILIDIKAAFVLELKDGAMVLVNSSVEDLPSFQEALDKLSEEEDDPAPAKVEAGAQPMEASRKAMRIEKCEKEMAAQHNPAAAVTDEMTRECTEKVSAEIAKEKEIAVCVKNKIERATSEVTEEMVAQFKANCEEENAMSEDESVDNDSSVSPSPFVAPTGPAEGIEYDNYKEMTDRCVEQEFKTLAGAYSARVKGMNQADHDLLAGKCSTTTRKRMEGDCYAFKMIDGVASDSNIYQAQCQSEIFDVIISQCEARSQINFEELSQQERVQLRSDCIVEAVKAAETVE